MMTNELIYIRNENRQAHVVRGLDRDDGNPAWPGHPAARCWAVDAMNPALNGFYRVKGRVGLRVTLEDMSWPGKTLAVYCESFPEPVER